MSERKKERREKAADRRTFIDIIDASEARDAGIVAFEGKMRRVEKDLMKQYKGLPGSEIDHKKIDDLKRMLNDEWAYLGYEATVTGRAYLTERGYGKMLPEAWGEPIDNEDNAREYLYLEGTQLCSQGIGIFAEYDEDRLDYVRVVYLFSPASDDEEDEDEEGEPPILEVSMDDISKHEYSTPTVNEAEHRLARRWPEQYELINHLLKPDLQSALPLRLTTLNRMLQPYLQDSEQFIDLVTIVVNDRLSLDQNMPYALNLTKGGEFKIFYGDDLFAPDTTGQWLNVTAEEDMPIIAYHPDVHFSLHDDDSVRVHFIINCFNRDDGEVPEQISIEPQYLDAFRSTRARHSLAELAMKARIQKDAVEGALNAQDNLSIVATKTDRERMKAPTHIELLEIIESTLQQFMKHVGERSGLFYTTYDAALSAAQESIRQFLAELDTVGGTFFGPTLLFSGPGILQPRMASDLPDVSDRPNVFVFGIDNEQPYQELPQGETLQGIGRSIQAMVKTNYDSDGKVIGHQGVPHLLALTRKHTHAAALWDGTSTADITVEQKGIIPLDGTAEITIQELEAYRQIQASFIKLQTEYGRAPEVEDFIRLRRALMAETSEYTSMRHVNYLTELDGDIKSLIARGHNPRAALDVLESLLVNRSVWVQGTAFVNKNGEYIPDDTEPGDTGLHGTIFDIRNDIFNNDVTLIHRTSDGQHVHYMPLSGITAFRF